MYIVPLLHYVQRFMCEWLGGILDPSCGSRDPHMYGELNGDLWSPVLPTFVDPSLMMAV